MINKQVRRQHILEALEYIEKNKVPLNRRSTKYDLYYNGKTYPPKYGLSIATKFATGKELEPKIFNGGDETNSFLNSLNFEIREKTVK
jgi:hypothetical protein